MKNLMLAVLFFPAFAMAQVVVETQDFSDEVFETGQSVYHADSSGFFVWFLFAISFVSFLIFWFNRDYVLRFFAFLDKSANAESPGGEDNQNNEGFAEFTSERAGASDTNRMQYTEDAVMETETQENVNIKDAQVIEEDSEEYKKPKLKVLIKEDEARLVFE